MLKRIKLWAARRSLAYKQNRIAAELQYLYDVRSALTQQEKFLMRYSQQLAATEIDLNIAARRANRDRAQS